MVRAKRVRLPRVRNAGPVLVVVLLFLPVILGLLVLALPYFAWTGPVGAWLRNRSRLAQYRRAVAEWEARNRA
jgi:hypothetical protein